MTFHKEGLSTLVLAVCVFAAINVLSYFLFSPAVFDVILGLTVIPLVLVSNFFRNPKRHATVHEGAIVAPADGKVVVIEECYEPEVLKCQCLQVSIFMSVLNVHINWFPISGTVKYKRHHNGRFQAAYLPKSSSENERTSVLIERDNGTQILVRQVAGALARRIVCYAEDGKRVKQSSQLGFIKFGSRVDLYLPIGTQIDVKLNDKVTGCQTVLGWFK